MFDRILVGIDGSEQAWRALDVAGNLARQCDAELVALHVVHRQAQPSVLRELAEVEHMPLEEEQARYAADLAMGDALARDAADRLRAQGVERVVSRVAEGSPARQIVELAQREGVDLIVLGSRGLGDVRSLVLGGVSHKVSHLAECACLFVR
jgi:nucleotide-binding universal stress UspA family protein